MNDPNLEVETEFKLVPQDDLPIIASAASEKFTTHLGQELFTQDELRLRGHSELIASNPSLCQLYINTVLASRDIHADPERDRIAVVAASNAISILNYGSRSGLFPFRFIDIRDWGGIRVPSANLNYAVMSHCNLTNADLSNSSMINISLFKAHLGKINLSGVKLQEPIMLHLQDPSNPSSEKPYQVAVHPDGNTAATSQIHGGLIRIIDLKTAQDVCQLSGHTSNILYLNYNRDGSLLSSVSSDSTVRIWDMTTYQCKSVLQLISADVFSFTTRCVFSPDNYHVAVGWTCSTIGIANVETSEWTRTFEHARLQGIDWNPDGIHILTYSYDGNINIWDVETSSKAVQWRPIDTCSLTARFTLDGTRIVASDGFELYLYDTSTRTCIVQLPVNFPRGSTFALDNQYIYCPSTEGWITALDLKTCKYVAKLPNKHRAKYLFSTADGQQLFAYSEESAAVEIYDVASCKLCVPTVVMEYPRYHSISLSPNGRRVIATCSPGEVRFLDATTGQCLDTAPRLGRENIISSCPSGRFIAIVPHLATFVNIYDVHERKLTMRLEHEGYVACIAFDPEGRYLASGEANPSDDEEYDGDISLWSTVTWERTLLRGHTQFVRWLCFSPNGNRLVSVSEDRTMRIWNMKTNECMVTIDESPCPGSISYSPCGRHFASYDGDYNIRIWNATSGKCLTTFAVAQSPYRGLGFLHNGWLLVLGDTYRILDISTGKFTNISTRLSGCLYISSDRSLAVTKPTKYADNVLHVWKFPDLPWKSRTIIEDPNITVPSRTLLALAPSAQEGTIVIASANEKDGSIHIRNHTRSDVLDMLQGHSDRVTCMHSAYHASYLASGSCDNTVRIWNLENKQSIAVLEGHVAAVSCVKYSPDDRLLASGSHDMTIRVWDLFEHKCIAHFQGLTTPIRQITFSPDCDTVASIGATSNVIHIWNIATGLCSAALDQHTTEVFDIQYSTDGSYLASASHDDSIRVWDIKTGECIATLTGHADCSTCFAFTSDGKTVISGSEDSTLRVWNVTTGDCTFLLKGHTGYIHSLRLTPDSRYVISASRDHVIQIWDISTGAMLHQLIGHTGPIHWIKLVHYDDQGETTLVSASSDGTVRLWTITKLPLRTPYLPELQNIIGAQEEMELSETDFTGAFMDDDFAKLVERYGGKLRKD